MTTFFIWLEYFVQFVDPEKQRKLDWGTPYKTIEGITLNIRYFHKDFRLKIIHRDLKVNNLLLDGDINSNIPNFDMTGIFGIDQIQTNTNRMIRT